jgi:hypothetical protein
MLKGVDYETAGLIRSSPTRLRRAHAGPLVVIVHRGLSPIPSRQALWGSTSDGVDAMNASRVAAIALLVAGILGPAYGGFTYPHKTQAARLGSIELSFIEKETVNVPIWAGVGAIVIGGVLRFVGRRKP